MLQMVGLGLEDDWPTIQDISSNSSDIMDTGEEMLMSPQEASYQDDINDEFVDAGMFL